jgi:hypothetical protein
MVFGGGAHGADAAAEQERGSRCGHPAAQDRPPADGIASQDLLEEFVLFDEGHDTRAVAGSAGTRRVFGHPRMLMVRGDMRTRLPWLSGERQMTITTM